MIASLRADITVLQEAPKPAEDILPASWVFWDGATLARGIAIILDRAMFPEARLVSATRSSLLVEVGAPHRINILGIWSCPQPTSLQGYVLETRQAIDHHAESLLSRPSVVVGDFNSSGQFSASTRKFSHFDLVRHLDQCFNLRSAYHNHQEVDHGAEPHATFYHYRHETKPFHLDYVFVPSTARVNHVEVGPYQLWKTYSDHSPLVIDCSLSQIRTGEPVPSF